jgi:uncharacterized protein (DUF58 family)
MASKGRGALLALGVIFLLMGLMYRSLALIALVIPIALLLGIGVISKPKDPDIEAGWVISSGEIMEGEDLTAALNLSNRSSRSVAAMVEVTLPEEAVMKRGRSRFPLLLRPGESVNFTFVLGFPRRGRFDLGGVKLIWDDLALFSRNSKTIPARGRFRVMPFIYPMDRGPFHRDQVRNPVGNLRSRLLGPGLEFHSIREYSPGDERRRINWKASARTNGLLVNQQHTERCGDVILVIDARESVGEMARTEELVDKEINAACSLASFYLRQRDRVGLLVMSDVLEVLPPRYGRRQFEAIVDKLLDVRKGGKISSMGLPKTLQRNFPSNALILIISPLDDFILTQSIKEMSARGHSTAVLAVRPGAEGTSSDAGLLRERIRTVRWKDEVSEVRSFSQVLEWDPGTTLNTTMSGRRGR